MKDNGEQDCYDCKNFKTCWLRIGLENLFTEANKRLFIEPEYYSTIYMREIDCTYFEDREKK